MIHKQHPSSFTATDLSDHLEKVGKKKIVLAGMSIPSELLFWENGNVSSEADTTQAIWYDKNGIMVLQSSILTRSRPTSASPTPPEQEPS